MPAAPERGRSSLSQLSQATPTSLPAFPQRGGTGITTRLPYNRGVVLAAVMAHAGGWDEALFVAAPLVVFAGLLVLAKRRAENQAQQHPAGQSPTEIGDDT